MQLMLNKNLTRDELVELYLSENGDVLPVAIEAAKLEQSITGANLGEILVRNGFLKQDTLIAALSTVTTKNLVGEEKIVQHVPPEIFYELKFKIAAETVKNIYVSSIGSEDEVRYKLQPYFPHQEIVFIEADPEGIESYISKLQTIHDSEASTLEKMIRDGIHRGASDIHMLQRYDSYTVFYRIHGVTKLVFEGDNKEFLTLSARIKDRAKMDMAEKRKPQDGGFDIEYNGRRVSLRVSIAPVISGEAIVMRILDPEKSNKSLEDLGITDLHSWRKGCKRLEGLNLICGMTGSGKTTTLTASIKELDRFGKVIYTAEDPVENQIPYVRQLNINELVGLDFGRALKAFMRMDPDVIVIGEVRDEATARNTIKAAETGHLVFATLHTGSILGAVNRMRDLGVPSYEIRSVLRSVQAQTLMRTLCPVCRNNGAECKICLGFGYTGRTVVSESYYFKSEEEVQEIIDSKKPKWKTMAEDAFDKVKSGITDEKEFIRIFGPVAEELIEMDKVTLNSKSVEITSNE
jgi:type II secretory ATPase GspE/PulE/Tfp pilus assembly ATPase PilB-like protein